MNHPWLSILMPVYNGERFIRTALESIVAQKARDIEVIAIDDGSTDATLAILESYHDRLPLQIVALKHEGNWVTNLNRALRQASGEYVSILHQDDYWCAGRVERLRQRIAHAAGHALLVHATWYVDKGGRKVRLYRAPLNACRSLPRDVTVERLLVQNFVAIPSAIFRRDAALSVGGMDERLWYTADWDLWLKLAGLGETHYVDEPLAAFRLHPLSQTYQRSWESAEFRRQHELVFARHLAEWRRSFARPCRVEALARFSIEMNTTLAALAHRQAPAWTSLARLSLALGLGGLRRYLWMSRLADRVQARLRSRLVGASDSSCGSQPSLSADGRP